MLGRVPLVETTYVTLECTPYALYDVEQPIFTLPEVPGLGFEPDGSVLDAYTIGRKSIVRE